MTSDIEWKTFKRDDQFLYSDDPELEYHETPTERTIAHRGQRKLALTMLQFLNIYIDPSKGQTKVVYAGAAPGIGIGFVARLYPQVEWHLYDPAKFTLAAGPNIRIYTGDDGFFTDDTAKSWGEAVEQGQNILFVSDIRADVPRGRGTEERRETGIWNEMLNQQRWVKIIRPTVAQLKFRLPFPGIRFSDQIDYTTNQVPYLAGILFLQSWAGSTSAESRLLITSTEEEYPMTIWDTKRHEGQMFHHNIIRRKNYRYFNPLSTEVITTKGKEEDNEETLVKSKSAIAEPNLLNTWDHLMEYLILNDYLEMTGTPNRNIKIIALSHLLTTTLSH
jgi:poly(A) polymerase regulatory subunit